MDERKVIDNMNLVYFILNKYYPMYSGDEDLTQSGMIGLCNAVMHYNESYGVTFSTYARTCILNAIRKEMRNTMKHQNTLSIESTNMFDEEEGNPLLEYIEADYVDPTDDIHLKDFMETLTEKEKIVCKYKALGYTLNEISDLTHYGRKQNISRILKKISYKWRRYNAKN